MFLTQVFSNEFWEVFKNLFFIEHVGAQFVFLIKKTIYEVKENRQHLRFNIFWQLSTWIHKKSNLHKILDC